MSATLQQTIETLTAQSFSIEHQIQFRQEEKNRKMLYCSDKTQFINRKYADEEDMVRNEMKNAPDRTTQEYQDLLTELKTLQNQRDAEVKPIEEESTNFQTEIDQEVTQMQSQLEAIKQDKQTFKEMQKDNIKKEFGYFE